MVKKGQISDDLTFQAEKFTLGALDTESDWELRKWLLSCWRIREGFLEEVALRWTGHEKMSIGDGCYHTVHSTTLGSEMGMSRARTRIKKATQRDCSTGSVEEGDDWPGRFFSCSSLFMNHLLSVCHVPDWLSIKCSNNNIYYAFSLCQTLF